ncbi:hypothetical protein CBM2592_A140007 [Cupriavidus taiwanensis]|nr:hypothetical protein CBM2588_A110118 [Cupriavidus taiwanensis]SOY45306.1 hypothetical protein CBM2592_A140007 [Cupriavidus taiwanensis]SOY80699.1 hypothetical protein CBM2591_A170078 [Cupriavidus taiwanensis]SOZ77058.1 hypothetical protein CBM2622_A140118 [Cupriavidus taiwanensis]SOZ77682.1 hypothetical protein CBM2618_A150117 [Cupriavidus taiwanensis]
MPKRAVPSCAVPPGRKARCKAICNTCLTPGTSWLGKPWLRLPGESLSRLEAVVMLSNI